MDKIEKILKVTDRKPLLEEGNKIYFINNFKVEDSVSDPLDRIKTIFKKIEPLYYFLIYIVSPVYPSMIFRLKKFLKKQPKDAVVLNLGSGNSKYSNSLINVDLLPYENVDVICDLENLPFKDNSVDAIVNIAVLEHVPHPEKAVAEMHRVLKKDGKVLSFIPFIQGFHASPYDFQRYTEEGIKVLFSDFNLDRVYPEGPTSGMLWIVQEWLAIVLSFGIKPLHKILYLLIMLLTFPIKFLDFIFIHYSLAKNISTGFTIVVRK